MISRRVREAVDLVGEYQRTGDVPLLTRAVDVCRAALAAAVRDSAPDIATYHNNLGYTLHELSEATADAAAQAESVGCYRAAVAAVAAAGPDDADGVPYLFSLASALRDLYGRTGGVELVHEAVQVATDAVQLDGLEPSVAAQYGILAGALGDIYEHAADPAVLTRLIAAYREAASYADIFDDPEVATYRDGLGGYLRERYERTGDLDALAEAAHFHRNAVAAVSGDKRLGYLSNLGDTLRLVFERTGDLDALTEAVDAHRTAVAGTWPGNPDLPRRATNLSGALSCRYARTGDAAALAEAITAARQAVAAAEPGDTKRGGYLNNLQVVLESEWERTGNLATLTESVNVARQAVAAAPPGHHLRALCLSALASAVDELYDRAGDIELLAESVQANRDALAATPAGDPDRAPYLHNLAQALATLFGRTGDARALDEALRLSREAMSATPAGDPARALRLGGLSSLLDDLAKRTGDAGPLTEAVATAREAVAAAPPDDPRRATLLDDLGSALTSLFIQTRNSEALREAVHVGQEALAATPEGHTSRITRLVNLAGSVQTLATRTSDPATAMDAAEMVEEALDALPDDHPGRALCLHNLSRIYSGLYRRFREAGSGFLDDAIRCARSSLATTPEDHADYARRLGTLSGLLLDRSDHGKDPALLGEALRLARQALAATAPDVPDYGSHLNRLGWALYYQHRAADEAERDPATLAEVWQCFYDTARNPLAPVGLRIAAYRRAAELAAEVGRTAQEALACIEAAVDLLPGVLPGQLDLADQEYEIGSVTHLAAHAAEAAVTAGRPDRAVELLERTRGVMIAAELDRRAGHDHLAWQTIDTLGVVAADGPVVYVYDGPLRCEALILTQGWDSADAGHVRVVQLSVSGSEVWDKADRLTALVRTEPADRAVEDEVLGILGWLRDRVTGPVLAAIGHDRLAASEPGRPRIWWCPVGIFSFLPLHATCLGEAVSSYAFTARSLRYARSQPLPSDRAASAPLVIAVPDAPGALPLPGADREADRIVGILPTAFRLERPTRKAVLAALPRYLVAHFACHGSVNSDDPGLSQLFLNDHVEDPLTVADIRSLRLTGGLAFLSACETAVTTVNLANEALHLTGAFQLAGYQHVVGTLWTVSDFASVALVRDFYTGLTAPGQKVIEVARAATALHDATRRLRDRFPNRPTLWAGHIHVGP